MVLLTSVLLPVSLPPPLLAEALPSRLTAVELESTSPLVDIETAYLLGEDQALGDKEMALQAGEAKKALEDKEAEIERPKASFSLAAPVFAYNDDEEETLFVSLPPLCEGQPRGYNLIGGGCYYCYGQRLGNSWGYQTSLIRFCRLFNGKSLAATPTPIPWPTPPNAS